MRFAVMWLILFLVAGFGLQASLAQSTVPDSSSPASVDVAGDVAVDVEVDAGAAAEAGAMDELVHKLRQGGIIVVLQILLSIFGLAVALERLVHLRGKSLVPPALVAEADDLWKQGKYDQLIETAQKDGSLLGQVIEEVVRHRNAGFQVVSQLAGDVAAREIKCHMQRLFPIALVATLEPLLGLLGTMLGMIGAFETVAVAGSMGDASILADDIAKALVTTAVGLIISIPAVFIYHYLKSQIGFGSASLDQAASGLISDWMLLGKTDENTAAAAAAAQVPQPVASNREGNQ